MVQGGRAQHNRSNTVVVGQAMNVPSPAVSVVLPVYNCPEYVGTAIESMLAQSFDDFEMIVIDDGSSDGTLDVVKGYPDARIRVYSQSNRGLAATLNRG